MSSLASAHHRILVLRAIAYLIDRGEMEVGWRELMQGHGVGVPEGVVRIEVELNADALWRAVSRVARVRPRPPRGRN